MNHTHQPPVEIVDEDLRAWLTDHPEHADADIPAGLDDLIAALHDAGPITGWRQQPPLERVGVWRTIDAHGHPDGVIVTADLRLADHLIRLATLHQDDRDLTGPAHASAIAVTMAALAAVAGLVNMLTAGFSSTAAAVPGPARWDADAIASALNHAADDLLDVTDADDEGLVDAVNLLVNAVPHYLNADDSAQPDTAFDRLAAVADSNYSNDLDTILGWIANGIR
jgi:hypothetical protein